MSMREERTIICKERIMPHNCDKEITTSIKMMVFRMVPVVSTEP